MKADKPEDHQTIFFLRTSNYLIIYQRRNKTEKYNIHVKVIRHNRANNEVKKIERKERNPLQFPNRHAILESDKSAKTVGLVQ